MSLYVSRQATPEKGGGGSPIGGGHQIKKMSHASRCIQLLRAFDRNTKANEAKTLW